MTAVVSDRAIDPAFCAQFIEHLDKQLESAARMLVVVHEQGDAIRRRDIQNVVRLAGDLQVEMHRREVLDAERERLLSQAGSMLGVDVDGLTVSVLAAEMDPGWGQVARSRNAELARVVAEIQREHRTNRALMKQELAFLDHLLRLAGSGGSGAYDSGGDRPSSRAANVYTRKRVFDLEA